jgi:hypothetical protein
MNAMLASVFARALIRVSPGRRLWRPAPLLLVLLLASCGGADADTTTSTVARSVATTPAPAEVAATQTGTTNRFDTANVAGLTVSPQDVYEEAKMVCGLKSARDIAADFDMQTSDRERISSRYARGYDTAVKEPAQVGCREGLAVYAKQHPGKQHAARVDPVELANRFFLATDNDAVALDSAISRAQDGDEAAHAELLRLQRRIQRRTAAYRRAGGPVSVGARDLVKAAVAAVDAFDSSNASALVKARTAASDARQRLTTDALKRP